MRTRSLVVIATCGIAILVLWLSDFSSESGEVALSIKSATLRPRPERENATMLDAPSQARAVNEGAINPRYDPAHPDYFSLNRAGLHSGSLPRESVGAMYDTFIRRIAIDHAMKNIQAGMKTRAANICGFDQWSMVEAALNSEEPRLVATRSTLQQLVDKAIDTAASVDAYAQLAWDDPRRLETFDPRVPHSTADWVVQNYPAQPKSSLLTFVTTTRSGDRVFQLHFFSSDFAELETNLEIVRSLKDAYWALIGG